MPPALHLFFLTLLVCYSMNTVFVKKPESGPTELVT